MRVIRKSRSFLLLILLSSTLLRSDSIGWRGDYESALKEAKKAHKPLAVFIIKKDTAKCIEVVKDIFINQPYIKELNKRFVWVMLNFEGSNYPIELYYTTNFPTLFLVDSDNETFLKKPLYKDEISYIKLKEFYEKR